MKTLEIKTPGLPEKAGTKTVSVRKTAGKGKLNLYDLAKGAGIAAVGGAWIVLGSAIVIWYKGGPFDIVWMDVARAAVAGFMGYININIFQQAKVILKAKDLIPEK